MDTAKKKFKKWIDCYPQGTQQGNEEQKFFIVLARDKKFAWKSVSALSYETNLSKERVEEIIEKYYNLGMIIQNPKAEDQWGYWERVPKEYLPDVVNSISNTDKKKRIDKAK